MRNFTYRSLDEKDNIEAVLRRRKKKVNRQQIIAGIIIFVILTLGVMYAIDKSFYTEYDAYIHIDINKVRAPYDIYLDSVYVKPGDVVHVGDTLYSYYVLDWLILEVNPNDEPSMLSQSRNLKLQASNLRQRIAVLEVKIAELRKQIAVESHNISFGLSDNSHKLDLERELKEALAELNSLRAQLALMAKLEHETEYGTRGTNRARKGGSQIYENPYSKSDAYEIRYNISNKDGFITNVQAPIGMIFFEKEDIIDMQHLDLKDNNLQVVAYVPVNLTNRIKDNMPAKVYVNDDLNFAAHVVMNGVRSEDIPENLRSYFARANKALIAILSIDEGQVIPFWSATAGLPVKVKIRNLFPWEDEPEVHRVMQYEVGKGLILKNDGNISVDGESYDDSGSDFDARSVASPDPAKPATAQPEQKPAKAQPEQKPVKAQPSAAQKPAAAQENRKNTAPVAAGAVSGRYGVVCAVLSSDASASSLRDRLKASGMKNASVEKRGERFFVIAASSDSKEEIEKLASTLRKNHSDFRDAWVLDHQKDKK
ncbi:MAG: SPOR domain-containing protein [Muribaculaceae bacterium]|nr:SPOR domain-containing protein [Muribaculaceae bacterium]